MVMGEDIGKLNKAQSQILKKAYESNERSIRLVNQMLNVARIEEGKFLFELSRCKLKDIIDEVLALVNKEIMAKKLKLEKNIDKDLPDIKADKEKLVLAISNVMDNAIKYTPLNGKISLSARVESDKIIFKINDNGIGIKHEDQPKIFSKFFRGENAVHIQTDGSGLGLFIAKSIIKGHNGQISFISKEGKGAEFTISLPIG
jgi:signal transduction histidine kinase